MPIVRGTMKETSFAVVIVTFLAFLGVLSGIVLLADNETSILEDAGSFLNQQQNSSIPPVDPVQNTSEISNTTNLSSNSNQTPKKTPNLLIIRLKQF